MILSLHQIKKEFPDINERDHTEEDFRKLFDRRSAFYAELPLDSRVLGFYEVEEDGSENIVINNAITGIEKVRTQAHEGCHLVLDAPIEDEIVKLFRTMEVIQTRQDITAEALSLILIFSYKTLEKYILTGEIPEHLLPYINERLEILDKYGV